MHGKRIINGKKTTELENWSTVLSIWWEMGQVWYRLEEDVVFENCMYETRSFKILSIMVCKIQF